MAVMYPPIQYTFAETGALHQRQWNVVPTPNPYLIGTQNDNEEQRANHGGWGEAVRLGTCASMVVQTTEQNLSE
jgi:hypothetical protein